ncbi:MAG: phosphoribosylanthranilate isomerase [Planctomycetia bacterium]|nr:phosphoribosylanthranilate isomerase [Planctomycetia bacterium]
MFQIKICGVTTPEDARVCAAAGADAIGLNFYEQSPRYVTPEQAQGVVAVLPAGVARVGVFVNSSVASILEIADRLQLDWIQLHGDEPPEVIGQLAPRCVLRAIRRGIEGPDGARQYLQRCQAAGCLPTAVLMDSAVSGAYGGTGKTADWGSLALPRDWLLGLPLVLAGGLTPENVAEGITRVRPEAVDTASGVESSPGRKSPDRLSAFIRAASDSFGRLPGKR